MLAWLEAAYKNGACTSPVTGDVQRAEFEHTHSVDYASSRRFAIERVQTPRPTERLRVYRDPAPRHVWLLSEPDGRHPLVWLHPVLVANGAVDIRWFTRDEWLRQAIGTELPY